MAKKKIIITLSRRFTLTHSRKGQPTDFAALLNARQKKHTIRTNYDLWKVNEEKMRTGNFYLSVRQWSGRPYHSKQVEIAQITTPIKVQRIKIDYHADNDTIDATIDGRRWIDADCYEIAKNDSLSTDDFKEWFFGQERKDDASFEGCIIQFTDFKY